MILEYSREWRPRGRGLGRFSSSLSLDPRISLGEGGTPTVPRSIRGINIFFKLEYLNPSGSFKDRGALLSLSYAGLMGFRRVLEDSSGNTGVSVALYSRALGFEAEIIVPKTAPQGKKLLLKLLGADIVEAGSRREAGEIALEKSRSGDYYYVAHTWSPFYIEASKTIAYEAYEQGFRGGVVVAPIGSGGLLLGLYHGFMDLVNYGLLDEPPTLIGVQGLSMCPVYRVLYGRACGYGDSSLADGIMVPNPPRLNEIADAIKNTGGAVVVVDNNDVVFGLRELIRMGFIVEPTSATTYAGLLKALEEGLVGSDNVLLPLTGSGLKMLGDLASLITPSQYSVDYEEKS